MRILDRWTLTVSVAMVIGALMACKKKEEPPPAPTPAAPEPTPAPSASAEPPKTDDVKRYGDKEKDESGTVRVVFANAKVFKEADETTSFIATLSLGTLVNRKARYGNWMLIDWPSGVGELSPGWITSKQLDEKIINIDPEKVKNQDAGVVVPATVDAAVPVVDASVPTTPDAAAPVQDAAAPPKDAGRLNWKKVLGK